MNITFKHKKLSLLNNLTSDLQHNIEHTSTLAGALNKTVLKFRHLPYNIGRCTVEQESHRFVCPVCNTAVTKGSCVRKLKTCKHEFHKKCIDNWLIENNQKCFHCQKSCVTIDELCS